MNSLHDFEFIPFFASGIVKSKINNNLLKKLRDEAFSIFNNKNEQRPVNKMLAGNIEKEYQSLSNEEFNNFILSMTVFYNSVFKQNKTYVMESCWLNFQKKYEFNPIHTHTADLSFVCWLQIPYDLKKEKENPSSINSNTNQVTDFYYLENLSIKNLSLSKENEGDIIMFHSSLQHGVHPFYTSDDYRISIAGNLIEKNEKNYDAVNNNLNYN